MKSTKLFILYFAASISFLSLNAQTQNPTNANINILTANAGVVNAGGVINLSVSVRNTGLNPIQPQRIRVTISVPDAIALPSASALQTSLATNWSILANGDEPGVIVICNNTDVIPANTTRTSIIKISANAIGGPTTISGDLAFGDGTDCSTDLGFLNGDNPADNGSTTSITVIAAPLPLTLLNFNATLVKCEPSLTWVTENELNTDRFEIERANANGSNFIKVGTVAANGNSNSQIRYNFIDSKTDALSEKVFYRLKMIDKDDKFKYSVILPVLVNCNSTKAFVYPNPVQDDKLFVSLAGSVGTTDATLISTSGQIILRSKINNGTNSITVSNIADGIYILNIKDANGFDKNIKVSIKH
ncbi:MAG: T9SS type A sorting domain-containing protein [Ferruginibacter sp.]